MVPYGTLWYHMVPYSTIRYHMVPYGTIRYHQSPIQAAKRTTKLQGCTAQAEAYTVRRVPSERRECPKQHKKQQKIRMLVILVKQCFVV